MDLYGLSPELLVLAAGGLRKGARYVVRVVEGGPELARQAGLVDRAGRPIRGLPPRVAEGESTVELAGPRQLARLATLHGVALEQIVDEGNPIDRIRHHAKSTDLLIVGYTRRARRNTVFSPDVSLFLLHDAPVSVLFVPRSDR